MRVLILANPVEVVSARFSSTSLIAELREGAEVVRAAQPLPSRTGHLRVARVSFCLFVLISDKKKIKINAADIKSRGCFSFCNVLMLELSLPAWGWEQLVWAVLAVLMEDQGSIRDRQRSWCGKRPTDKAERVAYSKSKDGHCICRLFLLIHPNMIFSVCVFLGSFFSS